MLKKYLIERDLPDVGEMAVADLGYAAHTSNKAITKIDGIQWQHSYVAQDKTFCVYLAKSEEAIHEHARLSGFPANKVTEIFTVIDPATEQDCVRARSAA
jgi:hypothetical protein